VRYGVLIAAASIFFLAGCGTSSEESESPPAAEASTTAAGDPSDSQADHSGPVVVPVTQAAPDDAYVLQGTATVTTEKYDDGSYGYLTVPARRGNSQSNRTPFLQGSFALSNGQAVACSMPRGVIWSDFDNFMDLNLKCDTDIDPSVATGFTIEPNG
jgi:hypothetical protein